MVFINAMSSNSYLHRNNKCSQLFTSDFGGVNEYPMKTKGKAHEALSMMFQGEGVPLSILMDDPKELKLAKF